MCAINNFDKKMIILTHTRNKGFQSKVCYGMFLHNVKLEGKHEKHDRK